MVPDLFRSRAALEAEILTLRHQINVLRRTAPKKQTFSSIDRLTFVCLYRLGAPVGIRALAFAASRSGVTWLSRAIAGVASKAADISAADRTSSFIIQFLHWSREAATFSKLPRPKQRNDRVEFATPRNLGEGFSIPAETKTLDICADLIH
jgi:hypothetical protein